MTEDQFWTLTDQSGDCWLWLGTPSTRGYGVFVEAGCQIRAHRRAFELSYGPIPIDPVTGESLDILHQCDNPPCVRPTHLFAGTAGDNMQDASAKGRLHVHDHHGEGNPKAKLTWDQVRLIRRMHTDGWRNYQLADAFAVTRVQIGHIVRGEHWRED